MSGLEMLGVYILVLLFSMFFIDLHYNNWFVLNEDGLTDFLL